MSKEEAEQQAVLQMGDPIETGKQLNQEHHPLLGYFWLLSKTVLLLLIIPVLIIVGFSIYSIVELATPAKIDHSIMTIPVDLEFDIPTHHVSIDNLCLDQENNYYLTYRCWTKLGYSRAGWSSDIFYLETSTGERLIEGSYHSAGLLGNEGYKQFIWPKDNRLYIIDKVGHKTELNLEEYAYETK